MGFVMSIAAIGFLLIAGIVAFSLFGSAFDEFNAAVDEKVKAQSDQSGADVKTLGNLAEDTGTRVCNLKVEFVGMAKGNLLDSDLRTYSGNFLKQSFFTINNAFDPDAFNTNVLEYQWYCTDPGPEQASLLDLLSFHGEANANSLGGKLATGNIFETDKDIKLRYFFTGDSINNGKKLAAAKDPNGIVNQLEFSDSVDIGTGTKFPLAYGVPVYLYDVTEDDYEVDFWVDKFPHNDKPIGFKFQHNICKPGTSSC